MSGVTLVDNDVWVVKADDSHRRAVPFPFPRALLLLLLLLHEAFPGSLFWNPTVEAFGSTNHLFGQMLPLPRFSSSNSPAQGGRLPTQARGRTHCFAARATRAHPD